MSNHIIHNYFKHELARACNQQGITLTELLITLVIAGILLTVAVPSFRNLMSDTEVRTATNELVASLAFTRSEAISRGASVAICASTDQASCASSTNWKTGWIVFTDSDLDGTVDGGTDVILQVKEATDTDNPVTADAKIIWFGSLGTIIKTET